MLKLIIEDDEGRKTVVPFVREEITIGRQEGNTIRLTERNVSRRHARLLRQNGHVLVEDLQSSNGIRVNGERIQGSSEVHDGDLIQIGDYDLAVQKEGVAQASPPPLKVQPPPSLVPDVEDAASGEVSTPGPEAETELETPVQEETVPVQLGGAQRLRATSIIHKDEVDLRKRQVEELEADQAPRLFVLNTEFQGREFWCIRTEMRIGRTEDNDIALDHRSLSRTHAKLVREPDGDWRIIDLQSANGFTVNGDKYAEATLSLGDVLELGHVKMQFLAAGEEVSPRLLKGSRPRRGRGLVAALVGLALVGAGGVFVLKPHILAPYLGQGEAPPEQSAQAPIKPAPQAIRLEPPAPPKPPAPSSAQTLQAAQKAMAARHFDQAVELLEGLERQGGSPPSELEALLSEARLETRVAKNLSVATKELNAGHLELAEALLTESRGTRAFVKERTELQTQLKTVRERLNASAVLPPAPRKAPPVKTVVSARPVPDTEAQPAPESLPVTASGISEATAFYEDGFQLFKKKQFKEAEVQFKKCLFAEPTFSSCHMMLGTTYANLKSLEKGAFHYRRFLELAPEHPKAAAVRKHLDDYEKAKAAAQ